MDKKSHRTPKQKQESFEQINASWAIEGQVMDARDLYNQRRIISGEATHEEILDQLREEYGVKGPGSDSA